MFQLTDKLISAEECRKYFTDEPQAGAFCSFEGWVRNNNDGKNVSSIFYEAQPRLCQSEADKILIEVEKQYGTFKVLCIHRIGQLNIGDCAVWIGVSTKHRQEAFAACRFVIDEIKQRLPIWKKESYSDQSSDWIDPSLQIVYHSSEKEYYSKQLQLPEFNDKVQQSLKGTKALVIGAGGLGCSALISLAQAGIGHIGIAEYDKVELSNLHRQSLYRFEDVGSAKIDLAAVQLNRINPFITITKHPLKVTRDNIEALISDYSYILDCSDDIHLKKLLKDICPQHSKILIQASVYQYEGQLSLFFPKTDSARASSPDLCSTGTCRDNGVLGIVPQIFGHLQALEVIKIAGELISSREDYTVIINLLTLETRKIKEVSMNEESSDAAPSLEIQWANIKKLNNQKVFVDVREDTEIMDYPVEEIPTVHLPLSQYADGIYDFKKDTTYVIFCAHGMRSYALAERLSNQGAKNIYSLTGGYDALRSYLEEKQRV